MKLQILVSSLNQEVKSLAEKMNLQADTILINQCNENRYEEWTQDGHQIRCYHLAERGVGLSRNNALLRADADLCLFSDEDIVYDDGAVERIIEGFEQHPEADMLLFNVRVQESRFTYWNSFYKRVRWYNCGRYPAYSFALRTAKMHEICKRRGQLVYPRLPESRAASLQHSGRNRRRTAPTVTLVFRL